MAILRAQVVFPFTSNKPEDVTVNTWHFNSSVSKDQAADQIKLVLDEFYNTVPPPMVTGGSALAKLADYMSNAISRVANAGKIKVYDLADGMPREATERTLSLFPSSFTDDKELPAEVALCGSFYAGRNTKRQRGRIYLGPLMVAATEDQTNRSRPTLALRDSLASSLRRLITPTLATVPGIDLAVFSRVDGIARVATAGWVDDAWDTQRRRGQDATVRTVF